VKPWVPPVPSTPPTPSPRRRLGGAGGAADSAALQAATEAPGPESCRSPEPVCDEATWRGGPGSGGATTSRSESGGKRAVVPRRTVVAGSSRVKPVFL
jgi:hypothetical protein